MTNQRFGMTHPVVVGDVRLHLQKLVARLLHRLVGGDGDDVDGQHHGAVERAQLLDHLILDVVGVFAQEQHAAPAPVDLEVVALHLHRIRADIVDGRMTAPGRLAQVEVIFLLLAGAEEIVEDAQALRGVQRRQCRGQRGEPRLKLRGDAHEVAPGFLDVFLGHAHRQQLVLGDVVVGAHGLLQDKVVHLAPVQIVVVAAHGHHDGFLEIRPIHAPVVQRDLDVRAGVQRVDDGAPLEEHRALVLRAGDGVVDVGEAVGLAELSFAIKDAVRVHPLDRHPLLHRLGDGTVFLVTPGKQIQGFAHFIPRLWNL